MINTELIKALIVLLLSIGITHELTDGIRRRKAKRIIKEYEAHKHNNEIAYIMANRILEGIL